MTDETKKLFDAPWTVTREEIRKDTVRYCVAKSHLDLVAIDLTHEDAHRLARLPELYDALNKQAYYRCCDCLRVSAKTIDDIPLNRDMIEHGCPKNRIDCGAFDVWELIRKVRDGE